MKKLNKFWVVLVAIAMFGATGCSQDDTNVTKQPVGGDGSITIQVKVPVAAKTRVAYAKDQESMVNTIIEAFDNNIEEFAAYVFDYTSGVLEAKGVSADGGPVTITGLNTAGTKRVLVIANGANGYPSATSLIPKFNNTTNYSRMADGYVSATDHHFGLLELSTNTPGLLMTGENAAPLTLNPGANTVTIKVDRVAAKVELKTLKLDASIKIVDAAKFELQYVGIQRMPARSAINTGEITTTANVAMAGAWSTADGATISTVPLGLSASDLGDAYINLLYMGTNSSSPLFPRIVDSINLNIPSLGTETLDMISALTDGSFSLLGASQEVIDQVLPMLGNATLADGGMTAAKLTHPHVYLSYVLPNATPAKDRSTLLTFKGTYDGKDYFYPMEINSPESNPMDGTYIKRNTVYSLNVTIKNLIGTTDPDKPGLPGSLEVTVTPSDWNGPVEQDVIW